MSQGSRTTGPAVIGTHAALPLVATRGHVGVRWRLVTLDAAAIAVGWTVAARATGLTAAVASVVAATVGIAALHVLGLYRSSLVGLWSVEVSRLLWVAVVLGLVAAVAAAPPGAPGVGVAAVATAGASATTLTVGRGAFRAWVRSRRRRGLLRRDVVLVSGSTDSLRLVQLLRTRRDAGYRIVGVLGPHSVWHRIESPPWLGEASDVVTGIHGSRSTGALVDLGSLPPSVAGRVIADVHGAGGHVHLWSDLSGIGPGRLRLTSLVHEPLLYVEPNRAGGLRRATKRAVDVAGALVLLALTSPLLAAAAVAIRLDDGGPLFFRQVRVGNGGRLFVITKLRTMAVDAERRLDEVAALNRRQGPLFKAEDDPRITRVGRILRATSIDELPQLWDVLRGAMSLVGPRPALPSEVEAFDEQLRRRALVKPGLTGLWQVESRDEADFSEYRRLDLYYVDNWTLSLDLAILALTVPHVLARGVREARSRAAEPSPGRGLRRRTRAIASALHDTVDGGTVRLVDTLDAVVGAGMFDDLVASATHHRVDGYLERALAHRPGLAPELATAIAAARQERVVRHLRALLDLTVVSRALDRARTPWLIVKGPLLAERAHGTAELRSYVDLDVVVPPRRSQEAITALVGAGARRADDDPPGAAGAGHPRRLTLPYGTPLDVHSHAVDHAALPDGPALPLDEVFQRARTVRIDGLAVNALDREDNLLHLCLHAGGNGGQRLLGLKDIERTIATDPPDWDVVVERASAWGAGPLVAIVLARARAILHADVPGDVLRKLDGSRTRRLLTGVLDAAWPPLAYRGRETPSSFWTTVARPGLRATVRASRLRLQQRARPTAHVAGPGASPPDGVPR